MVSIILYFPLSSDRKSYPTCVQYACYDCNVIMEKAPTPHHKARWSHLPMYPCLIGQSGISRDDIS